MKVVLETPVSLSQAAIAQALTMTAPEEDWADVIVHPSKLREAMTLTSKHNRNNPAVKLRLMSENRMGMDDWKLRTKTVEVKSEWKM